MKRRSFLQRLVVAVGLAPVLAKIEWPAIEWPAEVVSDPILDELNAVTFKEIWRPGICDDFFQSTPLIQHLRTHCLIGGAYRTGDHLQFQKPQIYSEADMCQYIYDRCHTDEEDEDGFRDLRCGAVVDRTESSSNCQQLCNTGAEPA